MAIVNQIVGYLGDVGSAILVGAGTIINTSADAIVEIVKAVAQIGG